MKPKFLMLVVFLLTNSIVFGQDGKIVSKKPFGMNNRVFMIVNNITKNYDSTFSKRFAQVNFYRITYLSNGLKVTAYLAEPKEKGKYPCIITNRGGNRDFGQWDTTSIGIHFGVMATWGYVVIGSQYRGNDGGEGKEEFGGRDINDVLNLIPVLSQIPNADTSRIGVEGASRGGMMTYLALQKTCRFKAAAVTAGGANMYADTGRRWEEMERNVYAQLIPDYHKNKDKELKARSAIFWADQMCKTTPLLIMHGSADWRVLPSEAFELVERLHQYKHPTRFILFEGADHGISEYIAQAYDERKRHFDYYVRDGKKWPSMEPHGQ